MRRRACRGSRTTGICDQGRRTPTQTAWAADAARPAGSRAALLPSAALEAVRAGKAAGLLVAKMDRLSRSVVDGAGLMERAGREGWALHFADLDIDTSTPAGEMAANIIISGPVGV